jgi:hypothetical protein
MSEPNNKTCGGCGDPIASWNKTGYCTKTTACQRKYRRTKEGLVTSDEYYAPPCKKCGEPTRSKYGYCKRTPECLRLRGQAKHEAEYVARPTGWRAGPDCLGCGKPTRSISGYCNSSAACRRGQRLELKARTFEAYGGARCACCGETQLCFLVLDHVRGNGNQERKEMGADMYRALSARGFPNAADYQVFCANCNYAKGSGVKCPCEAGQRDS